MDILENKLFGRNLLYILCDFSLRFRKDLTNDLEKNEIRKSPSSHEISIQCKQPLAADFQVLST